MAVKFTAVTFFFQLVVMLPIHHTDTGDWGLPDPINTGNSTGNSTTNSALHAMHTLRYHSVGIQVEDVKENQDTASERMLWLYTVFVYLFSAYALYLIVTETKDIIRVRQAYLGSQSTVTDRTIRLSGIPEDLRSEDKIKDTIEDLKIGKVDSVLLCRDWTEIDDLFEKRNNVLRKLEEAWAIYLEPQQHRDGAQQPRSGNGGADSSGENARLLGNIDQDHKDGEQPRPQVRIWYGTLGLQSRKIDAIDYYEEKLRKLSEEVKASRRKLFKPMPLAFVTLDSTATAVSSW